MSEVLMLSLCGIALIANYSLQSQEILKRPVLVLDILKIAENSENY
jgi:hypothetical protein